MTSFKLPYDKAHLKVFVTAKELKQIEQDYTRNTQEVANE